MACIFPTHLCKDNFGRIGLVVLSRNLSAEDMVQKLLTYCIKGYYWRDYGDQGILSFYVGAKGR